jgi:hypothetical protein
MKSLLVFVTAAIVVGCAPQSSAPSNTTAPAVGTTYSTKTGKLSLTAPKGWYKVGSPECKEALKKMGAESGETRLEQLANQVDLMVMDFSNPNPTFQSNLNVIDSGASRSAGDKDLEDAFTSIQNEMPKTKLQHKLMKFPVGPSLCYWGLNSQDNADSGLVGYVVVTGGRGYVISFSCEKGEIDKFKPLTESVMQTVKGG